MEYQLAGIQNIALYSLDKGKAYEFVHQTILIAFSLYNLGLY